MAKETGGNSVTWTPDKLLEATKQVTGIVNAIAVMMKSVKEVDGFKDIKKTATEVSKGVTDYVVGLKDLAKTLADLNGTGLDVLTERFEADTEEIKDKDGNTIRVNKKNGDVKILTAIKSIGDIVSTMVKSMDDLSKMNTGPIAAMKIKMNMSFVFSNMRDVFDYIVKTFGKGFDEEKKKALETLITKPQYIDKTTEKTGSGDTAKEVLNEVTKGGEVGLFDVIKAFFDIVSSLNDIKAPDIIKFKLGMKLLDKEFDELVKYMVGLSSKTQALTKPGEMLKNSKGEDVKFDKSPIESLQDFFEKSEDIFEYFKEFGKTLVLIGVTSKWIGKGVEALDLYTKVFEKIGVICAEVNKIDIDDESVEKIEKLTDIAKNLVTISLWGSLLILLSAPAALGFLMTTMMVHALQLLSNLLVESFGGNNYEQISEAIKNLTEIVKNLTIIATLTALTGLIIAGLWPLIIVGLLGVLGIIYAMKLILEILTGPDMKKSLQDAMKIFRQLALIITIASGLIVMMVLLGALIIKAWDLLLFGLAAITIILVAIYGLFQLLQRMEKDITKGAMVLVLLAVCMSILALALMTIAYAGTLLEKLSWESFGKIMAIIGGFVAITVIAGAASGLVISGSIALGAMAVAMLLMGVAMRVVIRAALLMDEIKLKTVEKFLLFIGGLVATVTAIGLVSPLVILGSAAVLVFSVALLMLSAGMAAMFGVLKLMPEDVGTVTDDLKTVIKGFMDVLLTFANPLNMLALGLAMPGVVLFTASAVALRVAIGAIKKISEDIKEIDTAALSKDNINSVLNSPVKNIIDAVKDIDMAGFSEASSKMRAIAWGLTDPVRLMMDVVRDLINLTVKEYDANGKVKKIRQVTDKDFQLAEQGIISIVTSLGNAISGPGVIEALNEVEKLSKRSLKRLGLLVDPVSGMVESAKGLVDVLQKDKEYFKTDSSGNSLFSKELNSVISAYANLIKVDGPLSEKNLKTISSRNFANALDEKHLGALIKLTQDLGDDKLDIEKHTKATNNFANLIEKTNSIDTSKVKSVTDMFREMKGFSESINGNFEKLADVLNDKLIDALERLNDTLESDSTETSPNTNKTAKQEIPAPVGSTEKEIKEVSQPIQNYKQELADILKQARAAVSALEDINKNTRQRLY